MFVFQLPIRLPESSTGSKNQSLLFYSTYFNFFSTPGKFLLRDRVMSSCPHIFALISRDLASDTLTPHPRSRSPFSMQAVNNILLFIASYHHAQELIRPSKKWLAKSFVKSHNACFADQDRTIHNILQYTAPRCP